MSNKKLIILGIITACMVIWTIVQSHFSNRHVKGLETSSYLIQGLDTSNIDSIILGTGDDKVTLKRNGKSFVVTNKDNYPADSSDINNLISSCMDIIADELVTDSPSNHKDLGVTEEDAEYVVKFLKQNSELLIGVVVGKSKDQGLGNYVRMLPGNKVYATLSRPWIKDKALNYINRDLVSVDRKDIESVTVSLSDETYTLNANGDGGDIILENIPQGKKQENSDCENVFTALKSIRFEDVMKMSGAGEEFIFNKKYVCRLKDSTVYTFNLAQKDNKTFVSCEAEFTDKTPVTKEEGIVESEEELKKKEAKLLARDKADAFSKRHSSWVYEISEYDAKNLTKKLSELFDDKVKEGEKEKAKVE